MVKAFCGTEKVRLVATKHHSPCEECEIRHIGCHSHCESYRSWKADADKLAKEQEKQKQAAQWTASRARVTEVWTKNRHDFWKK